MYIPCMDNECDALFEEYDTSLRLAVLSAYMTDSHSVKAVNMGTHCTSSSKLKETLMMLPSSYFQ